MGTKISNNQFRVLSAIQLDAKASASEIAAQTNLSLHAVQYSLTRLKQDGVIHPFCMLNPHKLGLTDYCLFLNPIGHHQSLIEIAAKVLQNEPNISYAIQLAGEYLFSVSCFARGVAEVDTFLAKLRVALPDVSWDIQFAIRLEWTVFKRGYLGGNGDDSYLSRSVGTVTSMYDEKDLRLLSSLSKNSGQSLTRAFLAAGLPEATGRQRYKRLLEEGVVLGTPCYIDSKFLGMKSYRLTISLAFRDKDTDASFRAFGLSNPNVSDFVICIGAWDYEIDLQVEDPIEVGTLIDGLYKKFPGQIRQVRTMSDVRIVKLHQLDIEKCLATLR